MKINQFDRHILNYCKIHPDDALLAYFMKGIREAKIRKEAERRKWKMITTGLEHWGERERDD